MLINPILLFITALLCVSSVATRRNGPQSYHVVGKLLCGKNPAKNVLVKLVDDDFGKQNPDDVLDTNRTDQYGHFNLSGTTSEITTIDPQLKIYHDCADNQKPCQRRWKFELPHKYISAGRDPEQAFDIGTWNLEAILPGESRDCIH